MANLQHETYMRFPGGLEKAFTMSYDEGIASDKRFIKVIDSHGVKCTFNLNSGLFSERPVRHNRMSEEESYLTFKDSHHELGLHGHKHLFMTKVSPAQCAQEIVANREYLEAKYNRIVAGMAYPYGATNDSICEMLRLLGVHYGRTTESTGKFDIPKDFYRWNPTCHHTDANLFDIVDNFIESAPHDESKSREPYLFMIWGHTYDFDREDNWNVLDELLNLVAERQDVWYATNGEIYEYVTAFNNLEWGITDQLVYNPSALDVWVERDKKLYHIPSGKTVAFEH